MNKYEIVRSEVEGILPSSPIKSDLAHSRLTLKLLLELKSDADEALQIAAISHDIERAKTGITEKDLKDYSKIDQFKKEHAIRSADIICRILDKHDYEAQIVLKVRYLVEHHEVGGDSEANFLKDADSLSYFYDNIYTYLERNGKERTKGKIRFMYDRLSDDVKKRVHQIKFKTKELSDLFNETVTPTS